MSERDQAGGEIDFSDGELAEMGVELAGREGAQPARKSRSMLRIPVDEVPRPQGAGGPVVDRASTEPSLPAMPGAPPDAADEVVDHAFRNGGQAEGEVPATLHLAAGPARDELEIFSAQLLADRDRDRVIETQMEEADTDPKALAQLRRSEAAAPQPVEDTPTDTPARELRPSQPRLNPALAALARAVAVPSADGQWLQPPKAAAKDDSVWSSAPAPENLRAGGSLVALVESSPMVAQDSSETDDMELDDGELEEVEQQAPPPKPDRQRTLTPVVPPPPLPAADAMHAGAQPALPLSPSTSAPLATASQSGTYPVVPSTTPSSPPSLPAAAHASPSPSSAPATSPHLPPAMPPSVSAPHAMPPLPPTTSGQHAAPPLPSSQPPTMPPSAPLPPSTSAPINVNGAAANGAHPAPPPAPQPTAAVPATGADTGLRPRRKRRAKQWFEEIFDDDYLRTLPFLTPRQTEREARFVSESLQIPAGGTLLDLACGYGRHAMELAANGYKVTGLDLSLPLLIRAADAARRVGVNVNFIHGDMREMTFENEFDGAYCMFTSFGYFDDDTNRKVAANLARAIKPGGRLLLDVVNRDYLVRDLPTRVWWQGDGCVVLEEVDFNYFSSRLQVQRSIIFEDGRQVEQEISIRAYSLHEIGKVLHHSGFRVTEVSGGLSLRGKFFGADSRQLIVVAEKKLTP